MEISFRPAVMGVFVNNEGKVLIGSSPRDGGYKFPQGGIDSGESSVDAIKREMHEELGIFLDENNLQEMGIVRYEFPDNHGNTFYKGQEQSVFQIDYTLLESSFVVKDEEFNEMLWIHPESLFKFDTRHRYYAYHKALKLCNLLY